MLFKLSILPILFIIALTALFPTEVGAVPAAKACRAVRRCIDRLDRGKTCKVLPIADEAVVLPDQDPLELKQIRKGVWLYNDNAYLTLILRRGSRLAMIDIPESGNSAKEDGSKTLLTDAAEKVLNGTVPTHIDVVYSHEHNDHIGATNLYVDYMKNKYRNVTFDFWGTKSTKLLLDTSVVQKAPYPTKTVCSDGASFSLGEGLRVELDIVGGHAQEDMSVYIPPNKHEEGVMMYVDVVFPKYVTTVDLGITEDVGQQIRAQKEILKKDFNFFVGGHFIPGVKKDIAINIEYTEDLLKTAQKAIEVTGPDQLAPGLMKYTDPSAREYGNIKFFSVDVFRGTQVQACFRMMLEKWGCRLYGFDIVGHSHCLKALIHLATED